MKHCSVIESPIGRLEIHSDGEAICSIRECSLPLTLNSDTDAVISLAIRELTDYFGGRLKEFTFPVKTEGTPFQRAVWEACRNVPYGHTTTYGAIAREIGRPNAARAVGAALSANRVLLAVPCHRVTSTTGIGGFRLGPEVKKFLFQIEGISR